MQTTTARARTRAADTRPRAAILTALMALSVAVLATVAAAQDDVIEAHGVSTFGELKYGPDFEHWDYVNPDAPKGGEFSTWAFGTFDSLTPYILKGNAAA